MTSALAEVLEKLAQPVPETLTTSHGIDYWLRKRDIEVVEWLREHGPALLRDAGDAARYRWLRANNIIRVFPVSGGMMSRGGTRILANTKDWLPGDFTYVIDGVTKDVDAAIDAAMHAPGGATETPR